MQHVGKVLNMCALSRFQGKTFVNTPPVESTAVAGVGIEVSATSTLMPGGQALRAALAAHARSLAKAEAERAQSLAEAEAKRKEEQAKGQAELLRAMEADRVAFEKYMAALDIVRALTGRRPLGRATNGASQCSKRASKGKKQQRTMTPITPPQITVVRTDANDNCHQFFGPKCQRSSKSRWTRQSWPPQKQQRVPPVNSSTHKWLPSSTPSRAFSEKPSKNMTTNIARWRRRGAPYRRVCAAP